MFRADVERREEAAGRRAVRRRLDGARDLGRVHRVDEQEVGAAASGDGGEVAQVGEVAEAPRGTRAHRVQLRHEPPPAVAAAPRGRIGQAIRGDDEGDGCRTVGLRRTERALLGTQGVPAQRKVGGHGHLDAPAQDAVDEPRRRTLLRNGQLTRPSVFELDGQRDVVTVVDVHPQHADPGAGDHRRRQQVAPHALLLRDEGRADRGIRRGVDAHRRQHRPQSGCGNVHPVTEERPVLRRDAVGARESHQVGRGRVVGHVDPPSAPRGRLRPSWHPAPAPVVQTRRGRVHNSASTHDLAPPARHHPGSGGVTHAGTRRAAPAPLSARASPTARRGRHVAASAPAASRAQGAAPRHRRRRHRCRRTRAARRRRPP